MKDQGRHGVGAVVGGEGREEEKQVEGSFINKS